MNSSKSKADKYFAKFIRERDKDKTCVTCGGGGVKDCGHFLSRRFESTRYDEKNAHGQCQKCNRYEYGNQYQYGQQIDKMYGPGTAEGLLLKSRMLCKRNRNDFETIAKYYKDKL